MSASSAVDVGFLEMPSASPSASWSERGFPNSLLIAPYGVIMDYRWSWSSKVPPAPEVLARGALHHRGFCGSGNVSDGGDLAVPFSEGYFGT